jgi:hypothetical protein
MEMLPTDYKEKLEKNPVIKKRASLEKILTYINDFTFS